MGSIPSVKYEPLSVQRKKNHLQGFLETGAKSLLYLLTDPKGPLKVRTLQKTRLILYDLGHDV